MKDTVRDRGGIRLLFEVSWEVANKVGGIHTVLIGKAPYLHQQWGDTYILVGPYLPHSRQEWEESPLLFADWREYFSKKQGYPVYAGYWHVGGHKLTTLLIDFYPALANKNAILTEMWERYGVDSLTGGWDYVEPAIFGYTTGEVIRSFCEFYYGEVDAIAHFHEWLTGAGILYLRTYAPHISTLFTTHATVVGRATSGLLLPNEELSLWLQQHNLISKHSLEKASWQYADATTTVSEHTSREAAHYLGHAADVITPNGWDPPIGLETEKARRWFERLYEQWGGELLPFWLIHAGRSELRNKGTLALLQALARYRTEPVKGICLIVVFAIPADSEKPAEPPTGPLWVSHHLRHPEEDALLYHLRQFNLQPEEPIRMIYLPTYLEGKDGVINIPFYSLLSAMDASAFPSQYEPWGYTPQESLGLGTPTLSSYQAGFGNWMHTHIQPLSEALSLVDYAAPDPVGQITSWLYRRLRTPESQKLALREASLQLAERTRWRHFLHFYLQAYQVAHIKAQARLWYRLPSTLTPQAEPFQWHRCFFFPTLPEILHPLHELAYNLWWSWNADAQQLFSMIDPEQWQLYENPIWLLNRLSTQRAKALSENEEFTQLLHQVSQRFQSYMAQPLRTDVPRVAYLCMEYGFTTSLPFYSGGLGVLAGDYLKEASDQGYPLIGIGLLYRKGYFSQRMSAEGNQIAEAPSLRFTDLPIEPVRQSDGRWLRLQLTLGDQTLYLKVWRIQVGRVPLYLLDADLPENPPSLRAITEQLYTGEPEIRLQQEIVLGFGAQLIIESLRLPIDIFHYNEGHAALHILSHLKSLREKGFSNEEAQEYVRARTLFTTHTPVPAGHESFSVDLLRRYLAPMVIRDIGIRWETFIEWGKMPKEPEKFSLTAFALRFSAKTNAVSRLHAKVSQKIFDSLFPGYLPPEVPIQPITNGVHISTWQAPEWAQAKSLWETHQTLKKKLLQYLRHRLSRQPWPVTYLEAVQRFLSSTDENTLLLGFARRVATYKRHLLLFEHEGLAELLEKHPLRILIAGKAHPQDEAGKAALRKLWQKSLEPPYFGRLLFLTDYDMQLARYLVQGVDVWLNLPIHGQEACGTSGMKACMNGVLHLSIPDGWWAEVKAEEAGGWQIPLCTSEEPSIRDTWEAIQLTYILREEVLPAYFKRDDNGLPSEWIMRMEKAQAYVSTHFSLTQMLKNYEKEAYAPIWQRFQKMWGDSWQARMELLSQIQKNWEKVEIKGIRLPPFNERAYPTGEPFLAEVEVLNSALPPEALRAEVVFENAEGEVLTYPLNFIPTENLYRGEVIIPEAGVYRYAIRLYAWDPYLSERLWQWVKMA
ncbi:MAG: alpha-glucan family phosphorylase [Bacteroidia bacterium]|nr:alpha-glucan family phosphorylase [Bacteroidia bacterium]MDW8134601.1 alpha-glucan family phosphorylase [Bacteroidia bacterium]